MNINDMKFGELKQIVAMFNQPTKDNSLYADLVGKYVIIRSRNEGVNAGFVKQADETGVILEDARRLWYHQPAVKSESWYEGVANHGLSAKSKTSSVVTQKGIIEDYSWTVCTDKARESIQKAVSNANS